MNIIIGVAILVIILPILMRNNLIAKKKRVEKAFSTIDVYLEQRYDEIGALLEQTLNAMDHEHELYSEIAALRSGIDRARGGEINDKVAIENRLGAFINNPMMRTEAYPQLDSIKELASFTANQTAAVERQLASSRRQYNNNAASYNTAIHCFPTSIIAAMCGFQEEFEFFKVSEGKRERPTIRSVQGERS